MLLKGGSVALSLSSYGIGGCGSLLRSTTTTCSSFQFAHFRVSLLDMGMAKLTSSATAKRRPTWLHSFCTVSSTGSADEAVAGATTTPATATATADVGAHNIKGCRKLTRYKGWPNS
ncbi:hypothetical protein O6P43_001793 [Quillaja saponaria]|uniref:Uncharacterized protein n=1 Tax=Quillaja saponaria TaxID=32244 RepID=A0AAD7VNW9_QUISA|nr:hypothetical protein O6P43_001793 [Quillaja saponaria]